MIMEPWWNDKDRGKQREQHVQMTLRPPQIPNRLTRVRTWASMLAG